MQTLTLANPVPMPANLLATVVTVSARRLRDTMAPMLLATMHNRMAFARSWGDEIGERMALAGQYGLWGATLWNYAHPYWKNWADVRWYRRVNQRFLNS
jgi:hypothetical protein